MPDDHTGTAEIGCSMPSVAIRLVRQVAGQSGVERFLAMAGSTRDSDYLENVENWISLAEAVALLEAGQAFTGEPVFARRVGESAVLQHAGSPVATLLRSLGSPEAVLGQITQTAAKFTTVSSLEATETEPGRVVIESRTVDGHTRHPLMCEWSQGLLSSVPELFGLPPAHIEETECQAQGGRCCRYVATWDAEQAAAAADPERRVTALERQIAALTERLQSAYHTARDLVSPDELDTVLDRIIERASREVRAPGYVLVVRAEDDERIFSRGLEEEHAAAIAAAAMGGVELEAMLCVPVSSSRREYGFLIALHPAGQTFFSQERLLLELYAKHSAAVLEVAMALRESERRHDHVSALLSLAQALARAGTGREIAERLKEALPAVVDCDRVGLWLWDDGEARLRPLVLPGDDPDRVRGLAGVQPGPRDTPTMARLLVERRPLFTHAGAEEPYDQELLAGLGVAAVACVPVVAREKFLGVIAVSVLSNPERLRETPELIERLSGVAAIAAPAIQNGELIDELAHKASHDVLTGLLNRVGFGARIETLLGDPARRVGLLFVDLDGFKQVNDAHGHDAGDELLRHAAERLDAVVRAGDVVARLGGDEFAVVLPDIVSEDEVHAVAARMREAFYEPFAVGSAEVFVGASVGEAIWPDEGRTVDGLLRHADASMYRDKARAHELRALRNS
jgi:diguanylate cyclase (GGDEF)-like protein